MQREIKSFYSIFKSNQRLYVILIIAIVIITYRGFQYVNWNLTYGGWALNIIALISLYLFISIKKNYNRCHFYIPVLALTFIPFLSIINSYSVYNQSVKDGITATLPSFIWLLYFVLHHMHVNERTILRAFLYISLFIVFIQIVQQITYPNLLFGAATDESERLFQGGEYAEMRNGLWRFRMHQNGYYTVPILFLAWLWIKRKMDLSALFLFILMFVSIYLTLTRQVIFSAIVTLFVSVHMDRRINVKLFLLGLFIIGIFYICYDELFSAFSDQTGDDLKENYIRFRAATYFFQDSLRDLFTFMFGYGNEKSGEFLALMTKLHTFYHYYVGDVGFVGMIWRFGILYVTTSYYVLYSLTFKFRRDLPLYLCLFAIFTAIMSIMIFPMNREYNYFVWALILYICDLHINKSPLRLVTSKEVKVSEISNNCYKP